MTITTSPRSQLAEQRFDSVTTAEQRMLEAAETGGVAGGQTEEEIDLAKADTWPRERTIRAELLGQLCIDPAAAWLIGPLIARRWLKESS